MRAGVGIVASGERVKAGRGHAVHSCRWGHGAGRGIRVHGRVEDVSARNRWRALGRWIYNRVCRLGLRFTLHVLFLGPKAGRSPHLVCTLFFGLSL